MNSALLRQILLSRRKTVLALVTLLLLNVILYAFSSLYQAPRLSGLKSQLAERQRLTSGGVTQDAAVIYSQGKADLATWRGRIAPKKEFARFVGDLFELASGNSLKVAGVTYRPVPVKEENLLAFSIDFNVTGKYGAVKSFIADLQRVRDIMYIDNLVLNNTKTTEEAVSMKVQLTAFFRLEGQ